MNTLLPPARRTLFIWIVIGIVISQGLGENSSPASEFCVQWVTYKDPNTGACVPCSPCPDGYIAAVMCEFDRDTLCRPISDLGKHIESVVHHKAQEDIDTSINPSWLVQSSSTREKANEHQSEVSISAKEDMSPFIILLVCLSVTFLISVAFALVCILKSYRRREVEQNPLDPLKQGLLFDEDEQAENDTEKPAMDLDELLAVRYGRSLVTNNYIL